MIIIKMIQGDKCHTKLCKYFIWIDEYTKVINIFIFPRNKRCSKMMEYLFYN